MQRGVPVIPKSSNPQRLQENIEGAFSWRLSNAQKAALDALDCGKRFIDYPWKNWGDVEEGGAPKPSRVLA
jgi:diketogulonate reductase-like aldo/keto reductase